MTTKQEALEHILGRVRLFEERGTERPVLPRAEALRKLRSLCDRLSKPGAEPSVVELGELGALVVHLLRDTVHVVVDVGDWLTAEERERAPELAALMDSRASGALVATSRED